MGPPRRESREGLTQCKSYLHATAFSLFHGWHSRPRGSSAFSPFSYFPTYAFPAVAVRFSSKENPEKHTLTSMFFWVFLFPFKIPPTLELATSRSETVTPALGLPQRRRLGALCPPRQLGGLRAGIKSGGGSLLALRRPSVSGALPAFRRLSRGCVGGIWDFFARIEQKMSFVKFVTLQLLIRIEQNGKRFLLNSEKAKIPCRSTRPVLPLRSCQFVFSFCVDHFEGQVKSCCKGFFLHNLTVAQSAL